MEISTREIQDYLIFDLSEDISYENAKELNDAVFSNIDEATKKIVLNIDKVTYVNSFALGILMKTMQEVEKKGCNFYLMNVNPNVKTLLKVTGVLTKFKIFEEK